MLALSVRQPYAELILRGIKTIEFRSRATRVVGERFYLYASKAGGNWRRASPKAWSLDLAMPRLTMPDGDANAMGADAAVPPWMVELADAMRLFPEPIADALPTGVIVGSAVIDHVSPAPAATCGEGMYQWHLTGVRREPRLRRPSGHPQPVWFRPFG